MHNVHNVFTCEEKEYTMKNIIKSTNNNLIKTVRKLSTKKNRDKYGIYIIETKKMIDEAIQNNQLIKEILIREDVNQIYKNANIVEKDIFHSLSSLVTPDGYMAILQKKENSHILENENILILDKIQDPGNLGTLIRSAEAFGFNTIMSIDSVDFYNEKVLRSTMGSIFRLNLVEAKYEDLSKLVNHKILIADMNGIDFRDVNNLDNVAIVVGNEGNGISDEIKKYEHLTIKIPMQGKIESLNAGVSGSILMSHFRKG